MFFSVAIPSEADFATFSFGVDPRGAIGVGLGIFPTAIDVPDQMYTDSAGCIARCFASLGCLDVRGSIDQLLVTILCRLE